jgi:hypothetical protein
VTAVVEITQVDGFAYQMEIRTNAHGRTTPWQQIHSDRIMDESLARHLLRTYRRGADKGIEYRVVRHPIGEVEVMDW